jgi:hypothetical protein
MRILVVGKGGREHALVRALAESPGPSELFCFPGSDAIFELAKPVAADGLESLIAWMQANAIDYLQADACRVGGLNEVLAILLLAAKFGVPVCPHGGGIGLCEYVGPSPGCSATAVTAASSASSTRTREAPRFWFHQAASAPICRRAVGETRTFTSPPGALERDPPRRLTCLQRSHPRLAGVTHEAWHVRRRQGGDRTGGRIGTADAHTEIHNGLLGVQPTAGNAFSRGAVQPNRGELRFQSCTGNISAVKLDIHFGENLEVIRAFPDASFDGADSRVRFTATT